MLPTTVVNFYRLMDFDRVQFFEDRELESFIWRSMDVLRMFDAMKHEMDDTVDPADVDAARIALDEHNKAKKRIAKAPVDQLELEGQQLIQKLTGSPYNSEEISPAAAPLFPSTNFGSPPSHAPLAFATGVAESSDYGSGSGVHLYNQQQYFNPDFTAAAPHIFSLLNNLRSTRNDLYNLWNSRRQRLEQCLHWKLFEQDADK
uniref:Uncharacterized protein n=1 Tax=Romanomermis culicivorax TaxID=13658 RepID=A0A915IAE7_ROMCU